MFVGCAVLDVCQQLAASTEVRGDVLENGIAGLIVVLHIGSC